MMLNMHCEGTPSSHLQYQPPLQLDNPNTYSNHLQVPVHPLPPPPNPIPQHSDNTKTHTLINNKALTCSTRPWLYRPS